MMTAVRDILQSQQGLNHKENYHEFCRLLGRLKSNYQLSELVRTESYLEWLDLAASFSVTSFEQWQWSSNSIHYLLQVRLQLQLPSRMLSLAYHHVAKAVTYALASPSSCSCGDD